MQIYRFSFALLTGIMDLGAADLSIDKIPQMFMECSFFTQCSTASVLWFVVYTAPDIDLCKERIGQSIVQGVIEITSQSKGADRAISSRESDQRRPDRHDFSCYIYRGHVPLSHYVSGLCCFQHHHHCYNHRHNYLHHHQYQGKTHWLPRWTLLIIIPTSGYMPSYRILSPSLLPFYFFLFFFLQQLWNSWRKPQPYDNPISLASTPPPLSVPQ